MKSWSNEFKVRSEVEEIWLQFCEALCGYKSRCFESHLKSLQLRFCELAIDRIFFLITEFVESTDDV